MNFEGLQGLLKKKQKQRQQPQGTSDEPSAAAGVGGSPSAHTPRLAESVAAAPKSATSATGRHAAASSSIAGTVSATSDPYVVALQSVRTLQQQQQQQQQQQGALSRTTAGPKRSREDMEQESKLVGLVNTSTGSSCADASDELNVRSDASVSAPPSASLSTSTQPLMKSGEDVLAQREMGVAVLQTCLTQLEHYWVAEQASNKTLASTGHSVTTTALASAVSQPPQHQSPSAGALLEPSVSLTVSSSPFPIPRALRDYILAQFVTPNPTIRRATGLPEMTVLDREFELLAQIKAEVEAGPRRDAVDSKNKVGAKVGGAPEAQQQLTELLAALWYLVALLWQHSLDPHQRNGRCCLASTAMPREGLLAPSQQGWSPAVYLALQNALPADAQLLQGRAIAEEVDKWRALARTRQNALELLSYVCSDHETAAAVDGDDAAAADLIIPPDLRKNLHTMVVHHLRQERNFMAVRQDYVDITMGTANWKLGLFSGGEVHMRRSMERVERNRIAHLLNNEHATHLLQSVRELIIFVEHHSPAKCSPFFYPAHVTSTMAT